jgi:hypothetical protein
LRRPYREFASQQTRVGRNLVLHPAIYCIQIWRLQLSLPNAIRALIFKRVLVSTSVRYSLNAPMVRSVRPFVAFYYTGTPSIILRVHHTSSQDLSQATMFIQESNSTSENIEFILYCSSCAYNIWVFHEVEVERQVASCNRENDRYMLINF